jgi:hypothetical protein
MATRATYQVENQTFYCHWDGYPAGAAYRFAKMVEALTVPSDKERNLDAVDDRRGGYAFAFIRGNMDAEPTADHEEHGDTEYRYTLTEQGGRARIKVTERSGYGVDAKWKTIYEGWLIDWPEMATQGIVEVDFGSGWHAGRTYTLATVENAKAIKSREAEIAGSFKTMPDGRENPNKPIHIARMRAWRMALNEAEAPAPDTFIEA